MAMDAADVNRPLAEFSQRPFDAVALAEVLTDPQRLDAVRRVDAVTGASDPALDRLTALVTKVLGVPAATITLVHDDRQVFKSEHANGHQILNKPSCALSASFCKHTVVAQQPLVVDDAREHPELRGNDAVTDGVVAYAGVPLIDDRGNVLGSLCAHDTRPRRWTSHDISVLTDLSSAVITEIALREDIQRREVAEQGLRDSEERFRAMFEHSPEGVAIVAATDKPHFVRVNPAFARLHGCTPQEMAGLSSGEFAHSEDVGDVHGQWMDLIDGKLDEFHQELRVLRRDGEARWAKLSGALMPQGNQRVREVIVYARDIHDRKQLQAELQHQARHDELTNLLNRRSFNDEIDRATALAHRYREHAAVVFIDLDHFKNVNDALGHTAGDQVLAGVADAIRASVRGTDIVARLGGDEFAAILNRSSAADAAPVAEKIRVAIEQVGIAAGGDPPVTASIGVAQLSPLEPIGAPELLELADAALYASKRQGRNRVTLATDSGEVTRAAAR